MNPIEHAEHAITGWFHHNEESTMTDTTQAAGTAGTSELPFWTALHQNLAVFTSRVTAFLPKLEAIAADPRLDDAVDALLDLAGAGVADEVFEFLVGAMRAAAAASTASAPVQVAAPQQPAQPPAAPAGNGAQPAAAPKVM